MNSCRLRLRQLPPHRPDRQKPQKHRRQQPRQPQPQQQRRQPQPRQGDSDDRKLVYDPGGSTLNSKHDSKHDDGADTTTSCDTVSSTADIPHSFHRRTVTMTSRKSNEMQRTSNEGLRESAEAVNETNSEARLPVLGRGGEDYGSRSAGTRE